MDRIDQLLDAITECVSCRFTLSCGRPDLCDELRLPTDLEEYFSLYSEFAIETTGHTHLTILPATKFVRANPVIAGQTVEDDRSYNWFTLAEYSGEYVTIDLNSNTLGRCYDSFWDRHGVKGSCPIIARTFTEYLQLILKSLQLRGDPIYWEGGLCESFGDAYDVS